MTGQRPHPRPARVLWAASLVALAGLGAHAGQNDAADQGAARLAELRAAASSAPASGHDGTAFFLGSDDGAFKLKVGGQIQFRYMINSRDEPTDGNEDLTTGFQTQKTRLEFSGNVINKETTFYVQTEFSRSNGNAGLLDAWVRHAFNENWGLKFGQFKVPLLREESLSDKRQLAADRSVVNTVFTQARSQGVQLEYEGEKFRAAGAFTDGLNTLNTDFDSTSEADYALTARAEVKFAGDWKQFNDFTSWRESKLGVMLGGALHWQDGGETGGTVDTEVFEYTADLSVTGSGWNAYAAFVGRSTDPAGGQDADDYGFLVQGGVFVTDKTELFARYDVVIPDDDRSGGSDEFNTITAGVNHYFVPKSHAAKLTVDVSYFLDAQSESASLVSRSTATGVLPDAADGQIAARVQFQLLF